MQLSSVISSIPYLIEVLHQGKELTNAAAWKNRQSVITFITSLLVIANACGLHISATADTISSVAQVIGLLVNIYLTFATSSKVGIQETTQNSVVTKVNINQDSGFNDK